MKHVIRVTALLGTLLLGGCSEFWCWPFDCSSSESSSGVSGSTTATGDLTGSSNSAPVTPGTEVPSLGGGTKLIRFEFEQTSQHCPEECVFLFDSTKLIIETDKGTFERNGPRFVVRKDAGIVGTIQWDLSQVPAGANVKKATLWMEFDSHEGIANSDNTSVMEVYGFFKGVRTSIKTVRAKEDIKDKGYNKTRPNLPLDFTAYVQKVTYW
jgi:hypothetical protein